ncbi:hypothetical protein RE436_15580 [Streptomyces coelicolor]|uniref:hypothetical protein n=1 Tax=unclassified Streptomyces TaxID=2593676 RepID=UPI00141706BD|nr:MULTISPECIES: hypothetical protein [Streptomyces]MDX3412493.1 hypothetical protein [Streptomyces sp. ME02-6977A]NSL81893.1 hypothetical protein [Streptomyces coelicolor]WMT26499.1 hypothetical protein RE437_13815 [Streptomyces coelicolor]WMT33750.1 hypothetical protein RE436_15580 [Streptomyces coelicolor]
METRPVVVNGNQLKSASGKADTGEPETRLVPGISSSTASEPPIRVQSSPARV